MDYIQNGMAHGDVASRLMQVNFDAGALRPFRDLGKDWVTLTDINGKAHTIPLEVNDDSTLRYEEWKLIDDAVMAAARPRLKIVQDLRADGLVYRLPNGMGHTALLTQKASDVDGAVLSMDGLRESPNDRQVFDTDLLPLPLMHKDFNFSLRQIQTSRNNGIPFDTSMLEKCARKVAELAEELVLGVSTSDQYKFAGGTIYGVTDFPHRITYDLTLPTDTGWTGETLIHEVLAMKQAAFNQYQYGPYRLYFSPNWGEYLERDYKDDSQKSVRSRLLEIEGITDARTLEYLTGYQILLVQMTSDVIRIIEGLDITTVQWDTKGGMQKNFKVIAMIVPQLRADYNNRTGLVHGTAS
jgi:uncharacterized linocin/CFP29 family protein